MKAKRYILSFRKLGLSWVRVSGLLSGTRNFTFKSTEKKYSWIFQLQINFSKDPFYRFNIRQSFVVCLFVFNRLTRITSAPSFFFCSLFWQLLWICKLQSRRMANLELPVFFLSKFCKMLQQKDLNIHIKRHQQCLPFYLCKKGDWPLFR